MHWKTPSFAYQIRTLKGVKAVLNNTCFPVFIHLLDLALAFPTPVIYLPEISGIPRLMEAVEHWSIEQQELLDTSQMILRHFVYWGQSIWHSELLLHAPGGSLE